MVARYGITRGEEDKWRRITKLVVLTPASATETRHQAGRKFGAVLADGGAETARLDRPVGTAPGPAAGRARPGAAGRHRARHPRLGPPATCIDAPSLAWAVLREDGRDLARDYYTRLDRRSEQKPEDTDDCPPFPADPFPGPHTAALLNRDDAGLAKRLPYGGASAHPHQLAMPQAALAAGGRSACARPDRRRGCGLPFARDHRAEGVRLLAEGVPVTRSRKSARCC